MIEPASASDDPNDTSAAGPTQIGFQVEIDPTLNTSVSVTVTIPSGGVHTVAITWTDGTGMQGSATASTNAGNGMFVTLIQGLTPGQYQFSVSPTGPDASLFRSASASIGVPEPPAAPQGLALDGASASAASPNDDVTGVKAPTLTLRAAPEAQIGLQGPNGAVWSGDAGPGTATDASADDGLVSYTFTPSGLDDGLYTVSATATVGGQASRASTPFTFEVDTTPKVAIGGATRAEGTTASEILTGTADATASRAEAPTIAIYRGSESQPVATATVDASGRWISTPIAIGADPDVFHAVATDLAGNTATSEAFTPTFASEATDTPRDPPPPVTPVSATTPVTPTAAAPHVTVAPPSASLPAVPVAASGVPAAAASDPYAAGPVVLGLSTNRAVGASVKAPGLAFDEAVTVAGPHRLLLTGTASAPGGVAGVELFEGDTDLGPATLDPATGAWSFAYSNGPGFHTGLTAVATAEDGSSTFAWSGYDLTTGVRGEPYATVQDRYDPETGTFFGQTFLDPHGAVYVTTAYKGNADGTITTLYSSGSFFDDKAYSAYSETSDQAGNLLQDTYYNNDGTEVVHGYAPDQVLQSAGGGGAYAEAGPTTFSFAHGFGHDTIASFVLGGRDHDTISLPAGNRGRIDAILAGATDGDGGVTLHLGPHDSVTVDGVTAAQLQAHRRDIAVHA